MLNETFTIAITAFTFSKLTESGEIFDFWRSWVQSVTMNLKVNKMLYGCEKCLGGQIALWYVIFHDWQNWSAERVLIVPYSIFTTFLLVIILNKFFKNYL